MGIFQQPLSSRQSPLVRNGEFSICIGNVVDSNYCGGAVFTDNDEWANFLRSIVVHGKSGDDKYNNIRIGMNSRLDSIQAAILLPKLKAFAEYELDDVNRVAELYTKKLQNAAPIILPVVPEGFVSSWAQYTVQLPQGVDRAFVQGLYRKPIHHQHFLPCIYLQ